MRPGGCLGKSVKTYGKRVVSKWLLDDVYLTRCCLTEKVWARNG